MKDFTRLLVINVLVTSNMTYNVIPFFILYRSELPINDVVVDVSPVLKLGSAMVITNTDKTMYI